MLAAPRYKIAKIGTAITLSIGLIVLVILTLSAQARYVTSAGNNVYCVVPPAAPQGPFAACGQIFTEIQTAVNAAGDGAEIRVAGGVYTDVHTQGGFWQMVYISKPLTIQGGYTPPFTGVPDPVAHPTILDARRGGRVLYMTGAMSETNDITVAGLQMTGGDGAAGGGYMAGYFGGAIVITDTAVTLHHNIIYSNTAVTFDTTESRTGFGGAIYLQSSQALLHDNTIRDNLASGNNSGEGGGIDAYDSDLILRNNFIINNTGSIFANPGFESAGAGGGITIVGSRFTLENNTVLSNTAMRAAETPLPASQRALGGGIALGTSQGTMHHNTIAGNVAGTHGEAHGGGVYITDISAVTLTHNTIHQNVATLQNGSEFNTGGGISIYLGSEQTTQVTLRENTISDNIAAISGEAGFGGGLFAISGFFEEEQIALQLTMEKNVILNNTGLISGTYGSGGGVLISRGAATLNHNTIMSNTGAVTATASSVGGGLYLLTTQTTLDGNLIKGNRSSSLANSIGGGLTVEDSQVMMDNTAVIHNHAAANGPGIAVAGASTLQAAHTTIAGNTGGDGSGLYLPPTALPDAANIVVLTNTLLANQAVGISAGGGNTVTLNTLLHHNTPLPLSASPTATVTTTNVFTGNPRLAQDGYHLTAGSDAIDGGVGGVTADIDRQARSNIPDIGADEFWPPGAYLPTIFNISLDIAGK